MYYYLLMNSALYVLASKKKGTFGRTIFWAVTAAMLKGTGANQLLVNYIVP